MITGGGWSWGCAVGIEYEEQLALKDGSESYSSRTVSRAFLQVLGSCERPPFHRQFIFCVIGMDQQIIEGRYVDRKKLLKLLERLFPAKNFSVRVSLRTCVNYLTAQCN